MMRIGPYTHMHVHICNCTLCTLYNTTIYLLIHTNICICALHLKVDLDQSNEECNKALETSKQNNEFFAHMVSQYSVCICSYCMCTVYMCVCMDMLYMNALVYVP